MLASRNKGSIFTKDTKDFTEFKKLAELELGREYTVYGFFLNKKSQFGECYVAIGETFYINLPKSMNDQISDIISDARTDTELLESINSGNEKIIIKEVNSKKLNKKIRVVDFV